MPRITMRERRRRMRAAMEEAWLSGGHTPEDPGLREVYADLPRAPIRLISMPLVKDVNQGGLLRIADAYRLELVQIGVEEDYAIDFAGSKGTKLWQPHEWRDPMESIEQAKGLGYTTYALTLSDRSVDLHEVEWQFPMALVIGSENRGVTPEVEALCDHSIAIPLYGLIQSLNVANATGIALDYAVNAYRRETGFAPVRKTGRRLVGLEPDDYVSLAYPEDAEEKDASRA